MSLDAIPSSCKVCAFYRKCFGTQGQAFALERPGGGTEIISYPLVAGAVATRVLQAGRTGPAVLMLHGAGGRADRFRSSIGQIAAAGFRVFAVDLPGHGLGDRSAGFVPGIAAYAAFVIDVIHALGLDRVNLVGAGLGGHIAAAVMSSHPARTDRLVLAAPTGLVPIGEPGRERLARISFHRSREGARERLRRAAFNPLAVSAELIEEEFRVSESAAARASMNRVSAFVRSHADADPLASSLARSSRGASTLVIWGAQDALIPPQVGAEIAAQVPGSTLALIERAGHYAFLERPGIFNRLVLAFLDGELRPDEIEDVRLEHSGQFPVGGPVLPYPSVPEMV